MAILVVAAVAVAVLLVCIAFTWFDASRRVSAKQAELQAIANTLSAAVAPPLAAGDLPNLVRTLNAIGRLPDVTFVRVVDADGQVVHEFGSGVVISHGAELSQPRLLRPLGLFVATHPVSAPVIASGQQIGEFTLIGDLSALRGAVRKSLLSALTAGVLAAAIGLLLASRMQQHITVPISRLTTAIQRLQESPSTSVNIVRTRMAELDVLIDAFNDMSAQIQARDMALSRHRGELEEKVRLRTEELEAAKRSAEAANAAKTMFLANMSHEIRTPMNGVFGMTEMLMRSDLDHHQQHLVATISDSARNLLTVINDVLDISRIEAGKLEIDRHAFDLRACVEGAFALFHETAVRKGIGLVLETAALPTGLVMGDAGRLRQVLINLVGNAIKFTSAGEVCLKVAVLPDDQGSADRPRLAATVRFEVTDTGIGIAPDVIGRLQAPFSQADASVTRRFGGTGLGLAISRHIVQLMGGRLAMESEVGKGTTISFALEFACSSEDAIDGEAAGAPGASGVGLQGSEVLLAEDNPVNVEVARFHLESLGCRVSVAEDGLQAVEACTSRRFDLVLMDCQMPEMDGLTAAGLIRQHEQAQGLRRQPIVALTANAFNEDREKCLAMGMDDYLSKPFTERQLQAVVSKWVRRPLDGEAIAA